LRQANPGVTGLYYLAFDGLGLDFFARDGHREGAALVFAEDGEGDFGLRLATHALDRFVQ
jgi:hypothetical protein